MPNWEPNRQRVFWDFAAAEEAAAALDDAAGKLEQLVLQRAGMAEAARAEWRGRKRQEFDQDFDSLQNDSNQLIVQLRAKAQQIRSRTQLAREEQQRRDDLIRRWEAESTMEKLAEQMSQSNQ